MKPNEVYRIVKEIDHKHLFLKEQFLIDLVKMALAYEGIQDLLKLWDEDSDIDERCEILQDLETEVEVLNRDIKISLRK